MVLMGKKWYVIHTYSGYDNKVKTNLLHRIQDEVHNMICRHPVAQIVGQEHRRLSVEVDEAGGHTVEWNHIMFIVNII